MMWGLEKKGKHWLYRSILFQCICLFGKEAVARDFLIEGILYSKLDPSIHKTNENRIVLSYRHVRKCTLEARGSETSNNESIERIDERSFGTEWTSQGSWLNARFGTLSYKGRRIPIVEEGDCLVALVEVQHAFKILAYAQFLHTTLLGRDAVL